MLSGLAPARRRLVLALAAAVVALGVAIAALGIVRGLSSADPVAQDAPGPVVVIAGYGGDGAVLEPIIALLRDEGRVVEVFPGVDDNTGDLIEQAQELGTFVGTVRRDSSATSVDLIGFSAGGVVARLWVSEMGGDVLTRRVVTIGSPHHGTIMSSLASEIGMCPAACEQLRPDSDVLRNLNAGDETPDGPEWITFRTDNDRTVTPSTSADLDGALNVPVQQYCPEATTGHLQLPSSPVVLTALPLVLDSGEPSAPTQGSIDCG
ncbi:lipase [soil metagenome]